jgi:hypothetical protein
MKGWFPKILPHLIAVVVFLVVAVIYCNPALEGKVLNQEDITQWKAAMKQSEDYREKHGELPLWTNALFSGMPTFAIAYPSNNYIPWWVHGALTLYLPKPIQFFFLACICFYFLCIVLRVNSYIGIFGALSFAYATYNPVIIVAGHDTKMWTMCYMPALLASILLIYDWRKYWLGAGLTALFSSILIAMNHPQIAYYFFIAVAIMTIFMAVRWIRTAQVAHMVKALGFTLFAAVIGILVNAVSIMSTYEYSKETIRGGSALASADQGDAKTGLGKDYAFNYSMAIPEPLVMVVPRMYGGSSNQQEVSQEKSKAVEYMNRIGQQLPMSFYWGGIGGTSGPPYVGAIVCFLAILAMFVLDNKHKWWMLATILLTIMMSWGKFFEGFNSILYNYLPLYNKFRAPSMILVIPQLLLPALAVMGLHKISFYDGKESLWPSIKKGLIANGVLIAVLFILYLSFDFMSEGDEAFIQQITTQQPQAAPMLNDYYNTALKEDRESLMIGDIFRTIGFMGVAFLFVYLLYRRKINWLLGILAITFFGFIDLILIDTKYLNAENYVEAPTEESMLVPTTQADEQLLADKSFFRVVNDPSSADPFSGNNYVSYHYNSVGGYHTARLGIYNDLIDSQLRKGNMQVYNMLNTKYIVQKDQYGATQAAQVNPGALGNAWFIKNLQVVTDARAEMKALDQFNPRETAFIQRSFMQALGQQPATFPGTGTIQLIKNDNDIATYRSSSTANEFAVFSEIYYAAGWKAFIDGKEAPIAKVNYVLRGVPIPAGNHEIVFRFEPQGYMQGKQLTTIFQIIMVLLLLAGIFFEWRSRRPEKIVVKK